MAVIFMDSANSGEGPTKWDTLVVNATLSGVSPSGRNAYRTVNDNGNLILKIIPDTTSVLVGWKGRLNTLDTDNAANNLSFQIRSDAGVTIHLTLGVTPLGAVTVRRGTGTGTLLGTSANGVIVEDTWHHYEFRATLNDTTGRAVVWIDGVATPVIDFTGDTKNAGTKTDIDAIRFGRVISSSGWDVCDISIASETTNYGVTEVASMLPTGNGNSSGMVGSDGNQTDNYLLADEATPNGDTDYNIGDTEGEKDTYAMANLPTGTWDVLAVQTNIHARKNDAGTRFMRPVLRTNSTDYTGTSVVMAESYDTHWQVFNTNPDTAAAWTEAEIDALEVGAEARDS